jgi:hypothetical protein
LEGKSIKDIDSEGNLKDEKGSIIAKAELVPELLEKSESQAEGADAEGEAPDLSILKGMKVNKVGRIVDENGNPHGVLVEGDAKKLAGRKVDGEGKIWDDSGKVIGRAELLPEDEREAEKSGPFEDFPDSVLDGKGNVMFENKIVGKLVEGDAKALEGKKVDADGDVLDKNGNTLGHAERYQEEEEAPPEEEQPEDLSALDGKKVNKAGNVVDDNGKLFGRVNSGVLSKLVGKKCDAEGKIWSESGKVSLPLLITAKPLSDLFRLLELPSSFLWMIEMNYQSLLSRTSQERLWTLKETSFLKRRSWADSSKATPRSCQAKRLTRMARLSSKLYPI